MTSKNNNIWPSEEELISSNDNNKEINLPPYGVISEYSDILYEHYNKRLLGIIMTRSTVKTNGDKTDFVYSLVLSQTSENPAQFKIFEVKIQDDGWYPAIVSLAGQSAEIGRADNEEQLRKLLQEVINSESVKKQIILLLRS